MDSDSSSSCSDFYRTRKGESCVDPDRTYEYQKDFTKWTDENEQAGLFMKDVFENLDIRSNWYFKTYERMKEVLSIMIVQEAEDEMTDDYARRVHEFFLQRKDVFEEVKEEDIGQIKHHTPSTQSFGVLSDDESEGPPVYGKRRSSLTRSQVRMYRTMKEKGLYDNDVYLKKLDEYGLLTVNLIDARMHEEVKDCAANRVWLIYLNIFQLVLSFVVFIMGAEELQGGQFPPLLAAFVAAIVGVVSSMYGLLGAIGENETYIVSYMVCCFWLMAILTAFLYTEIYMVRNAQYQCTPSKGEFSDDAGEKCTELYTSYGALCALAIVGLVVVFAGASLATNVLDSINDKTRLQQKQLFFSYFRIRNYEVKQFHRQYDFTEDYPRAMDVGKEKVLQRGKDKSNGNE
eukprot:TRINITY_DN12373_c0_g1_i2.p1 TRINITY_DN12373_c0_g1~~TRINITY_DN12373_c0_g1_i2.p1  ORF type:complete len:402 (+),score=74.20 TRINITY_DN12373_c0_g1_i2:105-1310(+)